ncbi:MAG: hypothetical protein L0287_13145, partial [Anaerolineae bacterium]|nr:hypothetical protein [Anaerolineae bacterium]
MKSVTMFLSALLYYAALLAQTPQWTLLRANTSGVIAVDPSNSNIIYINGVHKTMDGGLTWQVNSQGFGLFGPYDVIVDLNNPQVIYVSGDGLGMGVVKSRNGGLTWTKSDTGIVFDHHGYTVRAMALDAKHNILYAGDLAGGGGMYRSIDGAARWELLSTSGFNAKDLLVDEETGIVYVAAYQGVWKSEDQGKTWTGINNGLPIAYINPFTGDTLYAEVWSIAKVKQSRTLYAAVGGNGIYKSYNAGKNWFSVNNGLIKGQGGVVISQIDTNVVFADGASSIPQGIMSGLWRSIDGGQSWERYHQGLPTASPEWIVAKNLVIHDNALYLELQGLDLQGIYKLAPLIFTTEVKIKENNDQPFNFYLHPNYPNPFKNSTKVNYDLKIASHITLKVFDLNGKEVIS